MSSQSSMEIERRLQQAREARGEQLRDSGQRDRASAQGDYPGQEPVVGTNGREIIWRWLVRRRRER